MRRVVITGLGVVSPAGVGTKALWETVPDAQNMTNAVAEVPGFAERAAALPTEVQRLSRFAQFAVASALDAVADAGLEPGQVAPERLGISLATALYGTPEIEEEFLRATNFGKGPLDPSKASRDLYLASMSNTPGIILAPLLGAQGQCVTLSSGCPGGVEAIGNAYETIGYGDADVMVAGASEAPLTPITAAWWPPDAQPDGGLILGAGCGVVVAEEREHAARRGAEPYLEICGCTPGEPSALSLAPLSLTPLPGHAWSATSAIEIVLCALRATMARRAAPEGTVSWAR